MAHNIPAQLDATDWSILDELQRDGRISFSELGRRVAMSSPAVTERVRRLEETGVITGYRAVIDEARLGAPVRAIVRVRKTRGTYDGIYEAMTKRPDIRQTFHVTGDDCLFVMVTVPTMHDLERSVDWLAQWGDTTTSVAFSNGIEFQPITPATVGLGSPDDTFDHSPADTATGNRR